GPYRASADSDCGSTKNRPGIRSIIVVGELRSGQPSHYSKSAVVSRIIRHGHGYLVACGERMRPYGCHRDQVPDALHVGNPNNRCVHSRIVEQGANQVGADTRGKISCCTYNWQVRLLSSLLVSSQVPLLAPL